MRRRLVEVGCRGITASAARLRLHARERSPGNLLEGNRPITRLEPGRDWLCKDQLAVGRNAKVRTPFGAQMTCEHSFAPEPDGYSVVHLHLVE